MPWCPVCHAEYREGVKVCPQCQAELVDTPPGPGEHYAPPEESAAEAVAEALSEHRGLRAWGQQLREGFRLFGESFRVMLRMRNLWLLLAILTGLATVAVLRPSQPADPASLAMLHETAVPVATSVGIIITSDWGDPAMAAEHVVRDIGTGPQTQLSYFSWLYGMLSFRLYPAGAATRTPAARYDPWLWAGSLALTLLGVLYLAGMLRWVLAAVCGEEQTPARFWEGVRQSFWPLLAWTVVYGLLRYGLLWPTRYVVNSELRTALFAVVGLLLLPLFLTSKVIVALRPPLYWAPVISARVFARYLLVIVGFAIPFAFAHDIIWAIDVALRDYYYGVADPLYPYRYLMPVLAFAVQAAKVAAELLITTALVILVVRWSEANRPEPAQPEAASA